MNYFIDICFHISCMFLSVLGASTLWFLSFFPGPDLSKELKNLLDSSKGSDLVIVVFLNYVY